MGVLGRQSAIALFTVVEVAGLGVWLALARGIGGVDSVGPIGEAVPAASVGIGVLFVALFLEHLLTDATVNGLRVDAPVVAPLVFTATETALWALWLAVAEAVGGLFGVAAAGVVLLVLLVPQHTIEDNALRGRGLLSDLFNAGALGISTVEALGATVWLALLIDASLLERVGSIPGVDPALAGIVAGADPALLGLAALTVLLFVEHNLGVRFAGRVAGARDRATGGDRVSRI